MSLGNPPPPIINKEKPESVQQQSRTSNRPPWPVALKHMWKSTNARYAFLWFTGGVLFCLFGKRAIKKREEELVINDIENYLENKRKKDLQ